MSSPSDPFAFIDYHRLIDWRTRLSREWPFLDRVLATAPSRRVVDLVCGPGEHARLLASHGFEVVGLDSSAAQLVKAREIAAPGVAFVEGDIVEVAALTAGTFGGAICLGNTLPGIADAGRLARLLSGLRTRLLPGAPFIAQVLNYEKVIATGQRALPVSVLPGDDGELVLLRLMQAQADGQVTFTPAMLRYRADVEPPLEILGARTTMLHGWRLDDLAPALRAAGFPAVDGFGGFDGSPFDPKTSGDLVLVAR